MTREVLDYGIVQEVILPGWLIKAKTQQCCKLNTLFITKPISLPKPVQDSPKPQQPFPCLLHQSIRACYVLPACR